MTKIWKIIGVTVVYALVACLCAYAVVATAANNYNPHTWPDLWIACWVILDMVVCFSMLILSRIPREL